MGALSRKEIDDIYDSVPQAVTRADIDAIYDAPKTPKQTTKPTRITPTADMYDARLYAPKNREMTQEEKMLLDRNYRDQVWEEERKNRIPKLEAPRSDYAGYAREEIQAEKDLSNYVAQEKQQMYDQNRSRNAQRKGEVPILGSRLSANGQEDITDAGKAEIASLTKQREKLQKEINTFTTGDAGVDEANQSQTREKINEINGQIEKIKQDKHASTEDWLVPRDEYERLMRDPEFAKDIENLWKSDTSGMGGAYNAAAVSKSLNGMNVRQYYKHLEEKYGLSKKELKDIAKTAEYDAKNNAVEEYNEDVQEYGAAHPVVGSGLSLAATVPNAVEGALNVGAGLLTNDNRNISRLLDTTKTGLREGVKENTGDVGDVVYDVGMGLGDMAVGALTGNAPAVLAGNTANQATLSALDRGQNARQAALYGGASGVADYFYNKVGLDKARELGMSAVKSSGVKSILAKMGVAAGTEAGENVLQDITQSFLDEFINKENSELQTAYAEKVASGMTAEQAFKSTAADYAVQLLESGATGAVMGAGMYGAGAGKSLVEGGLLKRFADRNSEKTWNNVEEYEKAKALDAEEMARQNEIDAEEVAERQNQAAEEIQTLTEQLPEISLEPEDIERLNAGTDEGPRNEVSRETEEAPAVETRPTERAELDDAERAPFEELAAGYDGSQDYWHDVVMRAQEYALENNDVQRASRVLGELDRLSRESAELMELGGKPVWSMPDPARQLDGVADRINEVLNRVPLDDEKIALEADNIRNAIDNYKAALSGDDYDAVDRARKDLNNACKRFNTRANKIGLKGYDGTFGSKSFTYDIPETLGTGSPQRLWADINRQAKRNNALLSGEPTGDDFLVNLLLGENTDESASGELPKAADVQTENAPETARVSLENTGLSPDENIYRITSEDVNPGGNDAGTGNPPMGPNGPEPSGLNDLIPSSGEYDESRVITNTGIKSGVISPEDLELNPAMKDMSQHEVHKDKLTLAKAQSDVADYGDQLIREYTNGTRDIKTDLEVDRSMTILSDYDENLANWQRDSMMRNMSEHGTEGGQFIHAFRKWANTAVGALVKATKVDVDNTKAWKSRNQKDFELNNRVAKAIAIMGKPDTPKSNGAPLSHEELKSRIIKTLKDAFGEDAKKFNADDIEYLTVLAETRKVSIRQIADEIEHKLKTGEWFTIDESLPKKEIKNSQILEIVNRLAKGDLPKPEKARTPVEYSKFLTKIKNSLQDPSHGLAEVFNDADAYYVGKMLEAGVPKSTIEEEIRYRLNYGEWRTLDESLPVKEDKKLKNGMIYNMLDRVINGERPKAEKEPKAYSTFLKEIQNSLNDDSLGVGDRFNDADVLFVSRMIQEGVPKKIIEEELRHKLQMGEWFTIDESIEPPKPRSQKVENALKELRGEMNTVMAEPKTFDEIRNEVRNSLEKEGILDKFSDDDLDYLANLVHNGASQSDIAEALHTKSATGRWGISDETRQKVNRLYEHARNFNENSREYVEAQAEALRLLAEEVAPKATGIEKFDTWRYMAMLGNPKTMLRNYVGNKLFSAVTGVSNNLSALIERGVDAAYYKKTGQHIQRTKEILNPMKDKALLEATRADADNSRARQLEGSKYEKIDQDALKHNRSVWKSDVMRLAEKAVDAGISDRNAVVNKYTTSLAGYMKANGLDVSDIEKSYRYDGLKRKSRSRVLDDTEFKEMLSLRSVAEQMEKARDYAVKQAEYATFHEDNEVAQKLSQHVNDWRNGDSKIGKALGYGIEGMMPFKKTPANILRSAFEYSPLGAVKSIAKTGKLTYENTGKRKGNLADEYAKTKRNGEIVTDKNGKPKMIQKTLAADVIDSWSKTLTGSALTYLGYYLFSKGILKSSEKGEKYQDQLEGKQNYSIEINGHTYTLDWAAPGVMPLLLGAEIKKVMDINGQLDEAWYSHPDYWLNTINTLLDPMIETSMLSGVKDTLQTAANEMQYNKGEALGGIIGAIAGNTLTGYLTQAIPTLSGQIARTIDPTRRTTDTYNEGVLGTLEKQGRKIANKIPGLSRINTEYRDAYGRGQLNGPADYEKGKPLENIRAFENNLAYQMLSPGYLAEVNTTDADQMERDIFHGPDEEGKPIRDEGVYAAWRLTKKINGVKLNPEEMQSFREAMGEANYALRDTLSKEEWFNNSPNDLKNTIVKALNTTADNIGEYAVKPNDVKVSGMLKVYLDAGGGQKGIQAIVDELKADYNEYGLDKDTFKSLSADGEDLSKYEGYGDAIKSAGLTDTIANREAWTNGGESSLKEIADYNNAFKNAGMEEVYTSATAKDAYESGNLETYKNYRKTLKEMGVDDTEKRWNEYKEKGTIDSITEDTTALNSTLDWGSLGMKDSVYTTKDYERAKSTIPSLQPEEYATTFKEIDKMQKKNDSISQKEVIAYLNKIGASSSEGTKIWNAYLSNPTESSIPKLNDKGKWFIKKVK